MRPALSAAPPRTAAAPVRRLKVDQELGEPRRVLPPEQSSDQRGPVVGFTYGSDAFDDLPTIHNGTMWPLRSAFVRFKLLSG
jgi:hypothetical protein